MAPIAPPRAESGISPARAAALCPECACELPSWEADLVRHLGCPICGADLSSVAVRPRTRRV